jgi:Protein of unknown function (DUF4019)
VTRRHFIANGTTLFLTAAGIDSLRADQAKEAAAGKAAEAWLKLLDQGEYGKTWEEAGTYFKSRVAREQWEKQIGSVRGPLGALKSRKLAGTQYTKQLPGAPDGEYVVVQYRASFEHKESAVETVTPALDKDGQWRVVGYFIK